MTLPVEPSAVARWAESLSAVARTGLGFTENAYERERFEEILHIAGDMLASVDSTGPAEEHVSGWLETVAQGTRGYVTPKVAVGAFVGNDAGELLLIQRSDNKRWFVPTGWCDVGYSASEVVIKEVREECGLVVEPTRLVAVLDGMRGGSPIPHYTLFFHCRYVSGDLDPHPMECDDIGWFGEDALPEPLFWRDWWKDLAYAAIQGRHADTVFEPPRDPVWRSIEAQPPHGD